MSIILTYLERVRAAYASSTTGPCENLFAYERPETWGATLAANHAAVNGLLNLTDGQFIIGVTGAAPAKAAISGDATVDNTGALTIANGVIDQTNIASGYFLAYASSSAPTPADGLLWLDKSVSPYVLKAYNSGSSSWNAVVGSVTYTAGNGIAISGGVIGVKTGSSFPGSPSAGDLFFHTGLSMWFERVGSQWLSVERWQVKLQSTSGADNSGLSLPKKSTSGISGHYLETLDISWFTGDPAAIGSDCLSINTYKYYDGGSSTLLSVVSGTADTSNGTATNQIYNRHLTYNASITGSYDMLLLYLPFSGGGQNPVLFNATYTGRYIGS